MASNFLEWLAETPFLAAFLLLAIPGILISVLGILLVRAFYPSEYRITGTAAQAKINYMAEIYAVMIGLFLVSAFEQYQDMQTTVRNEALALRALSQTTAQFSPSAQGALPDLIQDYLRTVIEEEWPLLKFGDESQAAQVDLDRIFAGIAEAGRYSAEDRGIAVQAQQIATQVLTRRAERVTNGPGNGDALPNMLSSVLIILTLVAIALPWFVYTPYAIVHILLGTALVVVFISLITLAVKMLYPFAGELMLQPDDFVAALQTLTDLPKNGTTP
ncbi:DUF4239 domain-containing protein [Thiobaca trueperi]|uniref:Uncharacterized protein DUF4239 n=1 Tax=Thiobaca trueperi TaxID=127458 RepID=A0A4V2V1K4_9GAMM|nr:DUF4239 domain-containing protein [Thiobaca trueperi]TCT21462.1 uncharacterized protein DUF4239 [Thiobaca trueperi]